MNPGYKCTIIRYKIHIWRFQIEWSRVGRGLSMGIINHHIFLKISSGLMHYVDSFQAV